MTVRLLAGTEDLMRCRFPFPSLGESPAAVRTLADPRRQAYHRPWLRKAAQDADSAMLAPLLTLLPRSGYTPDFLTPPPHGPVADIDEELSRVAATPASQVAAELAQCLSSLRHGPRPAPPDLEALLLADPARSLAQLVKTLRACWNVLVAPQWARLRDLLGADIAERSRQLADGGLQRLLAGLHPAVRWTDGTLHIDSPGHLTRPLNGNGLLLMPSAFIWPSLTVLAEPPWQPTVIYPARGITGLWQLTPPRAPQALQRLIGRTRSELLANLREPASTTALAQSHGLSTATVSGHLTALRNAGLLTSHRVGRAVLYERTPLGTALAGSHHSRAPDGEPAANRRPGRLP